MTNENETNFNEIAEALAKAAGLESLKQNEEGQILFALDETMGVSLASENEEDVGCDMVIASIIVGPAPEEAEALRELLEENYLGAGSGDGSFSIESESNAVVLYRCFPLPVEPADFVNAFGRLVSAARAVKARLEGKPEVAQDGADAKSFIVNP